MTVSAEPNGVANGHLNGYSNGTNGSSVNTSAYQVQEFPLFHHRPLRAIVIGAGPAGITWHYHAKKLPWIDYTIYEKNHDVGGVWLENRYPGCACDIPSAAFQFLFNTHPSWSKFYAPAEEIHAYLKSTCDKIGIWPKVELNKKVTACRWDKGESKWHVTVTDMKTGETKEDVGDLLINGGGVLNDWKMPNIPGLSTFEGKIMHSAKWDQSYDFEGKRVAVIGSGSSSIQIVPQLQKVVKSLHSFNRSKTWILPGLCASHTPDGEGSNFVIPPEEKARLAKDQDYALTKRKAIEQELCASYAGFIKTSEEQKAWKEAAVAHMRRRLGNDEKLTEKLVPDFHVGCKRPTPGEGYLEALAKPNVTLVTDGIVRATSTGLILKDETEIEFDAIVCGTGFDVSYAPKYPVVGVDQSTDLAKVWKGGPRAYFGLASDGFPNLFHIMGPYAPVAHGSVFPALDVYVRYILQVAEKMSISDIKAIEIKPSAVNDFIEHAQAWLPRAVWSSNCQNWYGLSGELVVYPGSGAHFLEFMKTVRFEDFNITYGTHNSLSFLGNGFTQSELAGLPLTWYLEEYHAQARKPLAKVVA